MKKDLYIGATGTTLRDAYTEYGVLMGDGFLDTLLAPLAIKDFVTNDCRLRDGRVVVAEIIKKDYREVNLSFRVIGDTPAKMRENRNKFFGLLYGIKVDVYIPKENPDECFHLLYKGKSATHSHSLEGTVCTITARFEEWNPSNRSVPSYTP